MNEDFYTIVDDNGTYQVRASIATPTALVVLIEKLQELQTRLTKPKETDNVR